MALYLVGQAESVNETSYTTPDYPNQFVQKILFTVDDELSAAGATLQTENAGPVVCAAGSMARNADITEVRQFNGTSWVEVP